MERTGALKSTGCSNCWINWSVRYETVPFVYFEVEYSVILKANMSAEF